MAIRPQLKKLDRYGIVPYGTSDPAGANGDLFYNTASSELKIYINGWQVIGSSGGGGFSGTFFFVDETGAYFVDETEMSFVA